MTSPEANDTFLRDILAIDRTRLANERTLLAYIRTAIAIAVVGASLIKFFDSKTAGISGAVFIAAAAVMLFVGILRFRHVQRDLTRRGTVVKKP